MSRAVAASPPERAGWSDRLLRVARSVDLRLGLLATAGSVAAVVPLLRLWRANLRIPFVYEGDGLLIQALVKEVIHGWYFTNPYLGAPFGQELYDYPFANANTLDVLLLKAFGLFTSSVPLVLNLYFLLTFALCALTAFVVLRKLGVSGTSATVCSILFSLLPAHFLRGEPHLFLSSYFGVPLGAYLALRVYDGRPAFAAGSTGRRLGATTAATLLMCLVVATTSLYYALFTIALVASSGAIVALVRRRPSALVDAAGVCGLIAAVLVVELLPTIVYRLHHGTDSHVAQRRPGETEQLGLKIVDLVLPIDHHRLAPLAHLKNTYTTQTPIQAEFGQSLGTIGTIGFAAVLVALLLAAVRPGTGRFGRQMTGAGVLTLVALLFGTIGGIGTLISYTVAPGLHAWNRISIFIAFFALLGIGLMLDALRAARSDRVRRAFVPLAAAVLVLGVLDQTSDAYVPPYGAIEAQTASDGDFVRAIEQRLPAGAAVFQLPYLSFPEATAVTSPQGRPSAPMQDYDQFRGYLHSSDLRWSYGAIRGRPADWAFDLFETSPKLIARAAAAAGFDGIWIDGFGYLDGGAALRKGFSTVLGEQPLVSSDKRLSFFDLSGFAKSFRRRLAQREELQPLRAATLAPIRGSWGGGFWERERVGAESWHWTKARTASISLANPSRYARTVSFAASLATGFAAPSTVRVSYPDGSSDAFTVGATPFQVEHTFQLPPGTSSIRMSTDAPNAASPQDPRDALYVRVIDARGRDLSFPKLTAIPLYRPLLALRIF
jgi:phosphoglycerol transferase